MSYPNHVAILGAGFGGLMAGAVLAAQGVRVTVFDRATTVGGNAGWYVRRGRMIPTGATIAFGMERGGVLRGLLDEVGVEVESRLLKWPMNVVLSDRVVRLVQDRAAWEQELRTVFPDRAEAVVGFWRELEQLAAAVQAVTEARLVLPVRRWTDAWALGRFAMRKPGVVARMARRALWTVEQLMRAHGLADYGPLRELLNAQLVDAAQTDVRDAALLPASLALDIYRRGSFAFAEGGLGALARALAQRIEAAGGEVLVATTVAEPSYDAQRRQWRVPTSRDARGQLYDAVVDNTGVRRGEPGVAPDGAGQAAAAADPGWGAFRLDITLADTVLGQFIGVPEVPQLPFAFQVLPDAATAQLLGDEHGPVYATFHEALDGAGQPIAGEVLLTVSVHTEAAGWDTLDREAYKARKAQMQDAMLGTLRARVCPTLDAHIRTIDAGTPRTYKKYVNKLQVGGAPLTVRNALLRPKSLYSKKQNYYYAGENVFPGPGTLSSALSGYFAARALLRDFGLAPKGGRQS